MHPATAVIGSLAGAAGVLAWRVRETQRAVTAASIIAPPLGMSTGLAMFALPTMRVPFSFAALAFAAGALLFAYPLSTTTKLAIDGDRIMLQRSKAFLAILLGLVAIRLVLRTYIERYISLPQTAALFFLVAFGTIVPWRIAMYVRYRELRARREGKK
jgi:membrane protein CcdC involved in cytochrome C biogenesis